MKLSKLAAPRTTTFEVVQLNSDEPSGVFITANTPDSAEWVVAEKKYAKKESKTSIIIGSKGNDNRIEIDENAAEARKLVVIEMVTKITGLDEWKFSKEAVAELLNDPAYTWIYQQLSDHLSDRVNYFSK